MKQYVLMAALFASTGYASGQDHQAINLSYMDQSVRPQDDFYNFVNGNWMKTVEIPSDKARWGSFDELRENTDEATLKILKESLSTEFEKVVMVKRSQTFIKRMLILTPVMNWEYNRSFNSSMILIR